MQCEVLSHRLGLVPIKVDPGLFRGKTGKLTPHAIQFTLLASKLAPMGGSSVL